jgi:uncharacterized protein YuzE
MKIRYDPEVDALYITLVEGKSADSDEVQPGVILDYDQEGRLIGMEVLNVKKRNPAANVSEMHVDVA